MKIALSILIPLTLVVGGFIGFRFISENRREVWSQEKVHAVWIEDMEVMPKSSSGKPWDEDGSAPDLVASVAWRDNVVLKTPEASNTLLARWERTAVQISDLLKTNLSPTELENIARVRAGDSELLIIEVRDVDILSTEWVGAVSIPCGLLSVGKNRVVVDNPDSGIRSFTLRVALDDHLQKGRVPDEETVIEQGFLVMAQPVEEVPGAVEVREVGKQLESGAKFLKGLFGGGTE
jgi:hypothetical protein